MTNRMVKLARRPKGMVTREDFLIEDGPVPEPGAGEFRVRNRSTSRSIPPCAAG